MNEELQAQIDILSATLSMWSNFLIAIDAEDNQTIIDNGEENNLMAWKENEIFYLFDHKTLNSIDYLVAEREGIIPYYAFSIPNYELRKGVIGCRQFVNKEISNISNSIDALKRKQTQPPN